MDEYNHEYRYYLYLVKNSDSFEECIKNNVEIVLKIPELLEVVSQEISIAEKMFLLYHNKCYGFEISKSDKYALSYFNYLRENILYDIYCKKCLDINISESENHYFYELNIKKAPVYRHDLFIEYILSEFNSYIEVLAKLKNAVV
ncbi:hypothetical protein [Methanococcus maripaludis]|uniref:Uncharacterized protein n=2 Tax=Methanococcus maripaludis TaxID=39152 RepID=A0A7J9PHS1_METMI|nr:hypothetical protein [Methanococcus maripaludis]MBA2862661.1 hypothetical protein [Methanococcus maripaludis]